MIFFFYCPRPKQVECDQFKSKVTEQTENLSFREQRAFIYYLFFILAFKLTFVFVKADGFGFLKSSFFILGLLVHLVLQIS